MSNKTSKNQEEETASARKRSPARLGLAVILLLLGGYLLVSGIRNITDDKSVLVMPNGQRLSAEIPDDQTERQQGLSGRDNLAENGAMLFKFEQTSDSICFWMKDMKFSIDMVWLDEFKKVVTVKTNVSPDTYPTSFCPDSPAQFVIEVPAGAAAGYKLEPGAQVRF